MFETIDHIGIAVKNLEYVKTFYKDVLNIDFLYEEELVENKVKILVFKFGDTNIEYLEPLTDDSPIKNFLDSKGEGIHHIAFKVKNIEEKLNILLQVQLMFQKSTSDE